MNSQLIIDREWTSLLSETGQEELIEALRAYLPQCRWFQSKARRVHQMRIVDVVPMERTQTRLIFLSVGYTDGLDEIYLLPIQFIPEQDAEPLKASSPNAVIMDLRCLQGDTMMNGSLIDAVYDEQFRKSLLTAIGESSNLEGDVGYLDADKTTAFSKLHDPHLAEHSKLLGREQSNTSIKYKEALVLKLVRRLEEGINPELEIGRFLTEETTVTHVPLLAGYIEYRQGVHAPATVAVLQSFVENQGDAWEFTLDWLKDWFQSGILEREQPEIPTESFVILAEQEIPDEVQQNIGEYLDKAYLLGQRTAELHAALASSDKEKFRPTDFSMAYQRDLHESIERMSSRIFDLLGERLHDLPEAVIEQAQAVLNQKQEIGQVFHTLITQDIPGKRIRGHGDYHLGQVLYTGDDFVIVDFEGEPARPLPERYVKHSPLRDVAGMLRSFHYAAYGVLPGFGLETTIPEEALSHAEPWARYWRCWTSVAFLRGYLQHITSANIVPPDTKDFDLLLQILITEKAVYELGYEINNRPGWLKVPAQAIVRGA